jgi:hypothetical protein
VLALRKAAIHSALVVGDHDLPPFPRTPEGSRRQIQRGL